ncbi:MAG: S-layer homology domain-containing protein [Candidatus Saganbacteria bacterium]|nr:S-layer homology domain-containing protein [Candidatus Saganbacteria bacterium]
MKNLLIIVSCWLLVVSCPTWADGLSADPSRTLLGGKQLALGRSGVALLADPAALFINPAGLAGIQFPKFTATSRKIFFNETQYISIGGAVPTDWGTFGLGIIDANIADSFQTKRDAENNRIIPSPSTEAISYDNNVIFLSYSKNNVLRKNLSLGTNLKLYNQGFSGGAAVKAAAYGLDLGFQYQLSDSIRLGGNYQNFLSSNLKWSSSTEAENSLGGYIKLGTAVNILGDSGKAIRVNDQKLIGTFDLDLPNSTLAQNNNMIYHLGLEWLPYSNVSLRSGYDSNLGLSYGVGFKSWGFRFDYAYANSPFASGDNPHYFTLSYVGDLITVVSKELKDEHIAIKLFTHKNKAITTKETIAIKGSATYDKVYDKITSLVVPSISQKDTHETVTEEANLTKLKINNKPLNVQGSFEVSEKLYVGRNTFFIQGDIPGKGTTYETVRILRIIPYKDVSEESWAFKPIALTSTLGIIKGYPGNLFKPNKGISRAELVALLLRTKGILKDKIGYLENIFKDVKDNFWATPFILKGAEMNLVTGYPDKTFKPNKVLSRAEAITIISRSEGLTKKDRVAFPDLKEGYWANKDIAPAKEAGLLKYLSGKDFSPTAPFSRAEAAEVLYQTKQIQKRIDLFWDTGQTNGIRKRPSVTTTSEAIGTIKATSSNREAISTIKEIGTSEVLSTPEAKSKAKR